MISIIVAIYNLEECLRYSLESVCRQTYNNFEVILINDGSSDCSEQICKEFCYKDKRFKYFFKENGGLSDARNYGLKKASGEYIFFLDGDDYLHNYTLELLIKNIKDKDIAFCDLELVSNYGTQNIVEEELEIEELSSKSLIRNLYANIPYTYNVIWNKLYSKKLFKNVSFPKDKIHEDEFVNYKLYSDSNGANHVKFVGYYYVQRNNSITHSLFSKKSLDSLDAFIEKQDYYISINDNYLIKKNLHSLIYLYILNERKMKKSKQIIPELYDYKNKINNYIALASRKKPLSSFFYKFLFIIYRFNMR